MSRIKKAKDISIQHHRIMLEGLAGTGKTFLGLKVASALAAGQPFLVIDTENESSSRYKAQVGGDFDLYPIGPDDEPETILGRENCKGFHPLKFYNAIQYAVEQGYKVCMLDSISDMHIGTPFGCVDLAERAIKAGKANQWTAWKFIRPLQYEAIHALQRAQISIVWTVKNKIAKTLSEGKVVDLGEINVFGSKASEDEATLDYYADFVIRLNAEHQVSVMKSRDTRLKKGEILAAGDAIGGLVQCCTTHAKKEKAK